MNCVKYRKQKRTKAKRARSLQIMKGISMLVCGVLLGALIGTLLSLGMFETSLITEVIQEANK